MNKEPGKDTENISFAARLLQIDRRIIYMIVGLVIIIPTIFPFGLPIKISYPTQMVFDAVEKIPEKNNVLVMSVEYDPQSAPELHPMAIAILRHCFHRRIKVIALCLYAQNLGLAQSAIEQVIDEFNERATTESEKIVYGADVVFLGWKPPPIIPLLGIGRSFEEVFPTDFYGTELSGLPLMKRVKNTSNVDLIFCPASGNAAVWYIAYTQARFGVAVAAGLTGVWVADFYPYLQTGQSTGLLEGMKGAAEYETLVYETLGVPGRRKATEGMSAQSATHLAIILFVVLGNLGYFISRKK